MDPTSSISLASIADLLPNEHLLNFHTGVDSLPEWLGARCKLILGAGDLEQNDLNVKMFQMFDVFYCQPWDIHGSLRRNVEYLLENYYHQKVICFIDTTNPDQIKSFCTLFANRFELVDGYLNHTPHLPLECLETILQVGGIAVNIYEHPESILMEAQFQTICSKKTEELTREDGEALFNKVRFIDVETNENKNSILESYIHLLTQHAWKLHGTSPVKIDWNVLSGTENHERFNLLKEILAILLYYTRLPPSLRGIFTNNTRIWRPERIQRELVLVKHSVGAGGRRRKTRSKTTKRKIRSKKRK